MVITNGHTGRSPPHRAALHHTGASSITRNRPPSHRQPFIKVYTAMNVIKKLLEKPFLFITKISADNVAAYSAYVSFFLFISAFPFIMTLLAFIKYTPLDRDVLLTLINDLAPGIIGDTLTSWIHEIYSSGSGIMSISIILALWSASKGIFGIINSMNRIYDCSNRQNFILKRLLAILYTIILIAIIIIALVLIVFGNKIVAWLGISSIIFDLRILIAILMFFFIFLMLYIWVPNRKTKIIYELPGAVFTTAGWLLFSYLYSIYMNFVSLGNSIYGSLTTIILLLMWLYFCMYILFAGAEINVLIRNRTYKKSQK